MKKFRKLIFLLIFFLVGCQPASPDASLDADPMDVNQAQIYYDPIDKKLVKFDPNGNTSEMLNKEATSYVYDIKNADNLFIEGDSIAHKFKLIEIDGTEITTLHTFDDNQEIYPLGYNGGNVYFIQSFYENGSEDKDKRTISFIEIEEYQITPIEAVKGLVTDGIVSPNNIYYTVFNNEYNYHELYRKSIEIGKRSEAPELISVGYESSDVYLSKDLLDEKEIISLYASDKNRIYSKDDSWPKFDENYFKPTTVIGLNKEDDGNLHMTFVDKRSREVMNEVDDVVGIRFEGDTVVVATTTGASKY